MINWKKISFSFNKTIRDRALLKVILVILFCLTISPPVTFAKFARCVNDADCGGVQCCSPYGYCGRGPDYCRDGKNFMTFANLRHLSILETLSTHLESFEHIL